MRFFVLSRKSITILITILFLLNAQAETNSDVLQKVWNIGSTMACTTEARSKFDEQNFKILDSKLTSQTDLENLKSVLNPFLKTLGWSHTEFMTTHDESFYLFRGHSSSINPGYPEAPKIINPGIQIGIDSGGYYIREVLDGFPAHVAGVLKGDRIMSWMGRAFNGTWGVRPVEEELVVERDLKKMTYKITTKELNWNDAFLQATKNSEKIISYKGKRFGYVHLWTGVHKDSADVLREIVERLAPHVDGIVYDIRGGYGGAWWEHLDPFFKDRVGFFEAEVDDGNGNKDNWIPDPHVNSNAYLGKLVVLTNEGSRSGKEALAYQFKKSRRAKLIGTTTAGYFSGGSFFFTDQPLDYMLYLCVVSVTLDGQIIEGIGIKPDIDIPFLAKGQFMDSQLERALEELSK